jgi:serine/threonine protein kinase
MKEYAYIVVPKIKGCNILEYINLRLRKRMYLDPRDVQYLFKEHLVGLVELLGYGLSHGDVKPENSIIDVTTNKVWIIDFAHARHPNTVTRGDYGTRQFKLPQ